MNAARVAVVKKVFKVMDKDNSGLLDINDIRQQYNAKQHPLVKQGKKTEDEVLLEFLDRCLKTRCLKTEYFSSV